MDWVSDAASKRHFESFAAEASESLLSNGQQSVTDYTFLPPTAENLAKLRPEIPAGYTRAPRTEVTGPKPKTIKK